MTDDVAEIRVALEQTLAARTARITYATTFTWTLPKTAPPDRGPIRRIVGTAGKAVGRALGGTFLRLVLGRQDLRRHACEGVIDFAGRRCMLDYGSYATLQIGDQVWSGRSGRSIDTLTADPTRVASPLWLIDLLAGLATAKDEGVDEERDGWRRLAVTADLSRASGARPGGMPTPAEDRFEKLLDLSAQVWLDDSHLRQVSFHTQEATSVMTLSGFGTDVDQLDWSKLPTFASG